MEASSSFSIDFNENLIEVKFQTPDWSANLASLLSRAASQAVARDSWEKFKKLKMC